MQVGDEQVWAQAKRRRASKPWWRRWVVEFLDDLPRPLALEDDLFWIDAFCPTCAAPRLQDPVQPLAAERDLLLESILAWDEDLRRRCVKRLQDWSARETATPGSAYRWLRLALPDLYHQTLDDPRCFLYANFVPHPIFLDHQVGVMNGREW